ncbi:phosphotransferase enzyme family protein [Novisyntrophococcus fermenticellae]|uniref:phosphotransferase enzyme family protein n=1 Tax=Novisyntrophococcus fermenticellae TaxID=2068655 RepID=UPI001E644818|nr:aminoglycoside phosphotransferase family protein [Novisyntrophococcus fermenticellae]
MKQVTEVKLEDAIASFRFQGSLVSCETYGSGHINDTYLLQFDAADRYKKVILQRINTDVFSNPGELMENIQKVTAYLRERIQENGGDPERETLNIIPTHEGKAYYESADKECWRAYQFIRNAASYDQVEKPEHFYESARSFGNFQYLLADYPAGTLHETIMGFHDTKARFQMFLKAVKEDIMGRACKAQDEIRFLLERKEISDCFSRLLSRKEIPLRVTHNDTKLNNIMLDKSTGKGICVIDLDTVMPGLAMNDFGDSIRFGASTAAEDETDLDKVSCSMELYELYTRGFLEGCRGRLTPREVELLPMGAKVMTYECGLRFLTDYLQGDTYFKIHREHHNLERCRTQLTLVKDMEEKWETMQKIVKELSNNLEYN